MARLRYVQLPDNPTVAEVDAALALLLIRRNASGFAIVRAWVDAEINACLDLRNAADLDRRAMA